MPLFSRSVARSKKPRDITLNGAELNIAMFSIKLRETKYKAARLFTSRVTFRYAKYRGI